MSLLFFDGAEFEDNGNRAINHFFDPTNGQPLAKPKIPLELYQLLGGNVFTSPDWALGDNPAPDTGQIFSYWNARQYFFDALTHTTTSGTQPSLQDAQALQAAQADANYRGKSWGKLFQTLGQVMHHIQDMAQPQHVRNDPHLDEGNWQVGNVQLNPFYNPSLYEKYTLTKDITSLLTAPYPSLDLTVFTTPRSFWINGGKGIAEFTNSNFFSAGTNVGSNSYGSPILDPTLGESDDIQTLCSASTSAPVCPSTFTGSMLFLGSEVVDQNPAAPTPNPAPNNRAVTYSIFSADLQSMGKSPLYTLNRFDFDAAQSFLIPRAVAYSTALINYFFRGRMAISLPDEGVYAIIDHTDPTYSDPSTGGFPIVRLKIQNVTANGEKMEGGPTTGTLRAVAKYHINRCYTADLAGEYGSPGVNWAAPNCRDSFESISVSNSMPTPAGIDSSPQEVVFTFPNKIPIAATDLFLQVVYQGPLGQEPGAVVVATKDISEPTYLYNFSRWDQYTYCYQWPALGPTTTVYTTGSGYIIPTSCGTPMSYADWCATGFMGQGGQTAQADCNQAMGKTDKPAYSATATPVTGYDPNTSTIPQGTYEALSGEPPFTPLVIMPAPVGTYARVAILEDVNPQNTGVLVDEVADTEHSNFQFEWVFYNTPVPTINQCTPYANNACNEVIEVNGQAQTQTMTISRTYAPARGIYAISNNGNGSTPDEATLLNNGTASPMPSISTSPSQVNCKFLPNPLSC